MKTKVILISIFFTTMILIGAQGVFAQRGSETAGGTLFDELVNKKAGGTEFKGSIAIGYAGTDTYCSDGSPVTNMLILIRIDKGDDLQPFWNTDPIPVCYFDVEQQAVIIKTFFEENVIPTIEPNAKKWALKKIKNVVDTGMTGFDDIAEFLADIVIAVKK
jgi:hypothetical protein